MNEPRKATETTETPQNIAIIGAGIGGLSAAIALTKAGFTVTVFEQAATLGEVGAGIQLSPNATRVLHEWGLVDRAKKMGFQPKAIKISNWLSGDQIGRYPVNHNASYKGQPFIHIHRADIHQILLEAFRGLNQGGVETGAKLQALSFDASANQMNLQFAGDQHPIQRPFDWVIGADGIHSKVRDYVAPESKARFTGNVAWRGLVPVEKLSMPLRPDPCSNVIMGPGKHFVCYYVRGGSLVNYVAVMETDQWQEESWTIKADLDEMMNDFSGWNAQVREVLAHTNPDSCYRWALYDRDPLNSWRKDRCVILGDAAHPMLPFLAQGAGMAIEDASVLGRAFAAHKDNIDKAIDVFIGYRKPRTTKVQLEARKNMKLYHFRNTFMQLGRDHYLKLRGEMNPEFFNRRLSWLFDYQTPSI
ncbi:MAG: FAD-dependent oxidoreductase [Pseudomonadales bacterium]|nr:FAD-dependent oxidoreductase [Pseudomonadales bacterium]